MKALKKEMGEDIRFIGIGGPLMAAEGLSSLFPFEELSLMGLVELIPHLFHIRRRIQETITAIETMRPQIVVTIDSPGFNFRVGKALKRRVKTIPLVHYVAPSVWAWRPKRAQAVAQFLDHLLTLFPFEPPYFLKEGLNTTFVGHPVVELGLVQKEDISFRSRHGIGKTVPILTLLPGSRRGEIARLLLVFQETVLQLREAIPSLQVVIPTLPHLVDQIREQLLFPATLVTTQTEKFAAYKASTVALAASGTVSLELAAAGLPMVIAYKMNPLTYFLARRMIKVKYACLVNILLNEEVVLERLQQDCTPEKLKAALLEFFQPPHKDVRSKIREKYQAAIQKLHPPAPYPTPSSFAAQQICRLIKENS